MEHQLKTLLEEYQIENTKAVEQAVEKLAQHAKVFDHFKAIKDLKNKIIDLFTMHRDREEFRDAHFPLPNANVKKEYDFTFDLQAFPHIRIEDIKNLEQVGLSFHAEECRITGTPTVASTLDIQIIFVHTKDENLETNIKVVPFIINADPKDLWLDKPSPADARFSKKDVLTFKSAFLDKKIVVASKRGRSHAHNGTFRDDDFLVKNLPDQWAIAAVADGAGSSKYARAGSQFSCENIADRFDNEENLKKLSHYVTQYFQESKESTESLSTEDAGTFPNESAEEKTAPTEPLNTPTKVEVKSLIINALYTNVKDLHNAILAFAKEQELTNKDIHTTLIFTLLKKFDFGYVILSFGVGDCPINVLEGEDLQAVHLLNNLDVGESSGATRFITMPEIFARPEDMVERFKINCFKDLSKVVLMTDGIYDPKFEVESKLENIESWKTFLNDLAGENEDAAKVDFKEDTEIESQLSHWMDFWSKGNHDDRTLAIIY